MHCSRATEILLIIIIHEVETSSAVLHFQSSWSSDVLRCKFLNRVIRCSFFLQSGKLVDWKAHKYSNSHARHALPWMTQQQHQTELPKLVNHWREGFINQQNHHKLCLNHHHLTSCRCGRGKQNTCLWLKSDLWLWIGFYKGLCTIAFTVVSIDTGQGNALQMSLYVHKYIWWFGSLSTTFSFTARYTHHQRLIWRVVITLRVLAAKQAVASSTVSP